MNNYDKDVSVMINGRSYYLSGYAEPEKDGSRKVFMRLNHNSLCQIMQQDGDDETCTCLEELL